MCIADLAIGRRTIYRTTIVYADNTVRKALGADARRLGFQITTPGFGSVYTFYADGRGTNIIGRVGTGEQNFPYPFRIETYGLLITEEIWLEEEGGVSSNVYISEYLADYDLDRLIQREVG